MIAEPDISPYVAARHAVIGLTKAAAIEYAAQGIRINALAPGLVETGMTAHWFADEKTSFTLLANTPIDQAAQPEEMANLSYSSARIWPPLPPGMPSSWMADIPLTKRRQHFTNKFASC